MKIINHVISGNVLKLIDLQKIIKSIGPKLTAEIFFRYTCNIAAVSCIIKNYLLMRPLMNMKEYINTIPD